MAAARLLALAALALQRAACLRVDPPARPPKVFYLFLAKDGVFHEDIWADYFSQGVPGRDYQAFIHCQNSSACAQNIQHPEIFTPVDTVESRYCRNVIDPMLVLAEAAYKASDPHDGGEDKFAFLSYNSLPVKSLAAGHRLLTENSTGCASFHIRYQDGCHKSSQWSVLSRWHLAKLLQFGALPIKEQRRNGCLRFADRDKSKKEPAHIRYHGCADEFWPMMAIFGQKGALEEPDEEAYRTLRWVPTMWADWSHPKARGVYGLNLDRSEGPGAWGLSLGRDASRSQGDLGPSLVVRFTSQGLSGLASSEFVFMRKVLPETTFEDGNVTLRQAFKTLVFDRRA